MKFHFVALFLCFFLAVAVPAWAHSLPQTVVEELSECQSFRESDSLASWFDCHWEVANDWFDSVAVSVAVLDSALQGMWRSPRTEVEAESLLWVWLLRGWQRFQLGDVPASIDDYEQALRLYDAYAFADFDACEYLYKPLGSHYIRLGDNPRARLILLRALNECAGQGGEAMGGLYNNLALSYWNEGHFAEAEQWFREGLALPDVPALQRSMLWYGLAQTLFDQGRYDAAARALDTAARLLPARGADSRYHDLRSRIWLLRARLGRRRGGVPVPTLLQWLERSARFCRKAFPHTFHRTLGKVWLVKGQILLEEGHLSEAETLFRGVVDGLTQAGNTTDNTLTEAWDGLAQVALLRFRKKPDRRRAQQVLEALRQAARTDRALRQMMRFEGARLLHQQGWRRRTERALEVLYWEASAGAESHAALEALEWIERSRTIALAEAIWTHLRARQSDVARQWARLRRHLAYYEQQLAQQPQQQDLWLARQQATLAALDSLATLWPQTLSLTRPPAVDEALLRRHVGAGEVLCAYFMGEARSYRVCRLPDGQLSCDTLSLPAEVLRQSIQQLRHPDRPWSHAAAQTLTRRLLPDGIDTARALVVLPDGLLHYLPLSALLCDEAGLPRMPVRYGFSLTVLELTSRRKAEGATCSGWAPFAEAGRDGLAPLPHTARELEALPSGARLFVGDAATLSAFRQMAPTAGLIHLATHARSGALPQIEFADSALTADELYRLPLDAALVVLSACETLPGKEVEGEGVMGLARAFAYAGARGLVASLWQVNDATTAELWAAFYRYLGQGHPPHEALWRARRAWLAQVGRPDWQRHPWYWAGFIYLGPEQGPVVAGQGAGRWWLAAALLALALAMGGMLFLRPLKKTMASRNSLPRTSGTQRRNDSQYFF